MDPHVPVVDYSQVRDYLEAHGYRLYRCWPRPCHVYVKEDADPIVFPVRDRKVRRAIFENIKRKVEAQQE